MKTLYVIVTTALFLLAFTLWTIYYQPRTKVTEIIQEQNDLFEQLFTNQRVQLETIKELTAYIENQHKLFMLVVERQNTYFLERKNHGKRK